MDNRTMLWDILARSEWRPAVEMCVARSGDWAQLRRTGSVVEPAAREPRAPQNDEDLFF